MRTSAFGLAPRGANSEKPSEHVSDGFSYAGKHGLVEIPDLSHEPLRIDDPHLREECVRWFSRNSTDGRTERVPAAAVTEDGMRAVVCGVLQENALPTQSEQVSASET